MRNSKKPRLNTKSQPSEPTKPKLPPELVEWVIDFAGRPDKVDFAGRPAQPAKPTELPPEIVEQLIEFAGGPQPRGRYMKAEIVDAWNIPDRYRADIEYQWSRSNITRWNRANLILDHTGPGGWNMFESVWNQDRWANPLVAFLDTPMYRTITVPYVKKSAELLRKEQEGWYAGIPDKEQYIRSIFKMVVKKLVGNNPISDLDGIDIVIYENIEGAQEKRARSRKRKRKKSTTERTKSIRKRKQRSRRTRRNRRTGR